MIIYLNLLHIWCACVKEEKINIVIGLIIVLIMTFTQEQPSSLPETSAREVNIIYNMNDHVALTNDDKEIRGFIKDTYGEAPILIKREAPRDLSVPNKKNDAKSTELIENNSGDPKNDHSKSTKYYEGELQNQSEQKHTAEGSNSIGNMNVQDRKDEQGVADIGSSRPNQNFDDPTISSIQLEMVVEQGPNNSSSSWSPISMTKDTLHLTEGPVTYPSNVRDPGKLLVSLHNYILNNDYVNG